MSRKSLANQCNGFDFLEVSLNLSNSKFIIAANGNAVRLVNRFYYYRHQIVNARAGLINNNQNGLSLFWPIRPMLCLAVVVTRCLEAIQVQGSG
jgi:hypothetical protein